MSIEKLKKKGWVRINCDGGCGKYVDLREKKLLKYDFYLCNSKDHRLDCERNLPKTLPGQISTIMFNAASYFTGISYRWAEAEDVKQMERLQEIYVRGIAHLAIEKAKNK
jgi:hypothetical protein